MLNHAESFVLWTDSMLSGSPFCSRWFVSILIWKNWYQIEQKNRTDSENFARELTDVCNTAVVM